MDNEKAQTQIRELIDARVRAIGAKDIETLMANHAPDVLSFDVINDLQVRGADAVRERAQTWFSAYPGRIGYEVRDLKITAGADVAFCTYLYHVTGTLQDGGAVSMWVRATVCLQMIAGSWRIVHEHQSVPFDGVTGQAELDLQP
ncbi:MAG: nuclear transport factor 2 family protein [Caldilineaceae bacterium]